MSSIVTSIKETTGPFAARHAGEAELEISLHDASQESAVLDDWKLLDGQINNQKLACSWAWTQSWLTHYGSLVPHRFVVARHHGEVSGICLLTQGVSQRVGPFPVNTRHVGTAGEPEAESVRIQHNRILVDEKYRAAFVREIMAVLIADGDWDELRLDGFSAEDVEPFLLHDPAFSVRWKKSHFFDLKAARDAGDDVLSRIGYSTRKTIRRNLKAYGRLDCEWAQNVDAAESIFADLIRLHQARWEKVGQPGAYASRRFRNFHADLIRRLTDTGRVALFRVKSGTTVVGCVHLYLDGNRALCYQGGSASYDTKRSPGLIVDYLCIEECLRRGFDAYDFLGGDSHHKRRLAANFAHLAWACRSRPRVKHLIVDAARRIKHSINPGAKHK